MNQGQAVCDLNGEEPHKNAIRGVRVITTETKGILRKKGGLCGPLDGVVSDAEHAHLIVQFA